MTLEKEIEELKKKHASLELQKYNDALQKKYEELKKLEGTVEVRVMKTSKVNRHVSIVYHVSYKMMKDDWKRPNEEKHNYIGAHTKSVQICEFTRKPYAKYSIETRECVPDGYDGKIYVEKESHSYDFSTYKLISVDDFNAIWSLTKVSCKNILDGLLDIKDVEWVMNGTDEDKEFSKQELKDNGIVLDIKHIILTREESWCLNNKFCAPFLNKNIFFITPNSLKAIDLWYSDKVKHDNFAYSACASVGERWRGSRIDEYRALINKIKSL